MRIQSALSKEKYLSSLKGKMSGHMEWGSKRFTGFFLGSCFYVTHHAGFEWNRRYTNQKNAALGYVKQTETGSEVHFVRFRGAMCPMVFLPLFLLFYGVFSAMFFYIGMQELYGIGGALLIPLGIVVIPFAIALPLETFFECMTDESEKGRRLLLSMLCDPSDPKANLPYIP